MRHFFHLCLCALLCLACLALTACSEEPLPEGVVATVNGKPIMLRQVEAEHDVTSMSWFGVRAPSVEQLKAQYGDSLYLLIVQELITQALAQKNIAVTDAELADAENLIRADYPEGEFEKSLIEEYIDLDLWRGMLRYTLNQEKFLKAVLRPSISISANEAEAYYTAHLAEFTQPAKTHFILISGPDQALMKKARATLAASAAPQKLAATMPGLSISDLKLETERLPDAWKDAMKGLAPGKVSNVVEREGEFHCLILVENVPANQISLVRAYPLIERSLIEEKMDGVFDAWLEKELDKADIRVSPHLLLVPEERAALEAARNEPATKEPATSQEPEVAPADTGDFEGD